MSQGPLKLRRDVGGPLRCNKNKIKQEILKKLNQFNIFKSKPLKHKHDKGIFKWLHYFNHVIKNKFKINLEKNKQKLFLKTKI